MNPHSSEAPGPPRMELPPAPEDSSSPAENSPEASPISSEKSAAERQTSAPAAAPPPIIPLPEPSAGDKNAQQGDVSVTTSNSASAVVDDNDLIEKEWVNKAKQIVERNRDDPYRQSEELTVFKADYMKKHYDKTIKLNK